MMNTAADTALKMAQAQKEKEEAKKKAKETNLAEGQLKMQDIQLRLLKQQENINANTIVEGAAAAQTAMSNMTITANQADVSNKTKQAEIEKTYQELINMKLAGIQSFKGIKLTEAQEEKVRQEINWYYFSLMTGRISAEAARKQADIAT